MTGCSTCRKPLGSRNASGFCRTCQNSDPALNLKRRAGVDRYLSDPAKLHEHRQRFKAAAQSDHAKERRTEAARRIELWRIGHEAQKADPTLRKRAGTRLLPNKLTRLGVPREQWDTYRALMATRYVRSEEAVRMCLEKHEAEMARFRRELLEARAA